MPQTNIFFERGNHGRPCKSFRKRRQYNYILVSKDWLSINTVFSLWNLKALQEMSSKTFHTRESGIMTALLAEAGGKGLKLEPQVPPAHTQSLCSSLYFTTCHCLYRGLSWRQHGPRMLWNPKIPLSSSFAYSLPSSQIELFIRMENRIFESNRADRI